MCFVVLAEHLLELHRSRLELWRTGDLAKESVKENYEEYFTILRDYRSGMQQSTPLGIHSCWISWIIARCKIVLVSLAQIKEGILRIMSLAPKTCSFRLAKLEGK